MTPRPPYPVEAEMARCEVCGADFNPRTFGGTVDIGGKGMPVCAACLLSPDRAKVVAAMDRLQPGCAAVARRERHAPAQVRP